MNNQGNSFCILRFSSEGILDEFLHEASAFVPASISVRRLSGGVVIVARDSSITDEEWNRYLGMGFRGVFGNYEKQWYETHELRLEAIRGFEKRELPFAEIYWGGDCRIISTSDEPDRI